jgi:hypothetical protein
MAAPLPYGTKLPVTQMLAVLLAGLPQLMG